MTDCGDGFWAVLGLRGSSPKIAGYFRRGRILWELCFETDLGLIFLIEFFSHGSDLPMFELGDLDRAPSLGGSDQRTEHQLQDGSLSPNALGMILRRGVPDKHIVPRAPCRLARIVATSALGGSCRPDTRLRFVAN
jgi:hypothetical protein